MQVSQLVGWVFFPDTLKSAAAYPVQVARSSKGSRYRKSAKIDALKTPEIR
jgi:hypothetical protein